MPASTRVSDRLKRVQEHGSPVNIRLIAPAGAAILMQMNSTMQLPEHDTVRIQGHTVAAPKVGDDIVEEAIHAASFSCQVA